MAALVVMMLLSVVVAGNAVDPISGGRTLTNLANTLTGALDNGVTVCNNYTIKKVPFDQTVGLWYYQNRSSSAGPGVFHCGTLRIQTVVENIIQFYSFKGIFSTVPYEKQYLNVALKNGQSLSIPIENSTFEATANIVAFKYNEGMAFIACRWHPIAPQPAFSFEMVTKNQFPDPSVAKKLMQSAVNANVPMIDVVSVDQTNCPPVESYRPLNSWVLNSFASTDP